MREFVLLVVLLVGCGPQMPAEQDAGPVALEDAGPPQKKYLCSWQNDGLGPGQRSWGGTWCAADMAGARRLEFIRGIINSYTGVSDMQCELNTCTVAGCTVAENTGTTGC